MVRGFYTAAAGLLMDRLRASVAASNLGGSSTPGFKTMSVASQSFPALYLNRMGPSGQAALGSVATGVVPQGSWIDPSEGPLRATGAPLNMAILGQGFFAVRLPGGAVAYTRDGSFFANAQGQVVNAAGARLLDSGGRVVTVSGKASISASGTVRSAAGVQSVGVWGFRNPAALAEQNGIFTPTPGSGAAVALAAPRIEAGYLEGSNVQPARVMSSVLSAFQAYQSTADVLATQDQTLGVAVNKVGAY